MNHVVGFTDDPFDMRANCAEDVSFQTQLKNRFLYPVPLPLEVGGQARAPSVGRDVVSDNRGHRHDTPIHS